MARKEMRVISEKLGPEIEESYLPERIDSLERLEQGLPIDENALNEAWLQQPDSFYRVAKQLALMTSRRDAKKQELAETEAKADAETREVAAQRKEKITEPEIKAAVRLDPDVLKVGKELGELQYRVGVLGALERSYEMRQKALTKLVDLYIANYYRSGGGEGSRSAQRALAEHNSRSTRERLLERRQHYGRSSDSDD